MEYAPLKAFGDLLEVRDRPAEMMRSSDRELRITCVTSTEAARKRLCLLVPAGSFWAGQRTFQPIRFGNRLFWSNVIACLYASDIVFDAK